MEQEKINLPKFMKTGKKYGPEIAYRLFHECLPAMEDSNLIPLGNLIYDYRFKMGSIQNCSFVYPPIIKISKSLSILKESKIADVLSLSSVGPGMFAITKNPKICIKVFEENGLNTYITKIHNPIYKLIS